MLCNGTTLSSTFAQCPPSIHEGADNIISLAAEYGLALTYKEEFHQVFAENQDVPEFNQLLQRMKVVDVNGESSMDEDQWEAASEFCTRPCNTCSNPRPDIYVGFAFEKR